MNPKKYGEVFCQNCGKSLGDGWGVSKRKYCSNRCQMDNLKDTLLKEWLATGKMPNWTGGKTFIAPKTAYVRDYLIERQNGYCAICHCSNEWNGKPLVFILDHIDGDCTNNKEDNLQLICPNCNSQTDTFTGRNKGKGKRPVRVAK